MFPILNPWQVHSFAVEDDSKELLRPYRGHEGSDNRARGPKFETVMNYQYWEQEGLSHIRGPSCQENGPWRLLLASEMSMQALFSNWQRKIRYRESSSNVNIGLSLDERVGRSWSREKPCNESSEDQESICNLSLVSVLKMERMMKLDPCRILVYLSHW